jgi:hypothetical protein
VRSLKDFTCKCITDARPIRRNPENKKLLFAFGIPFHTHINYNTRGLNDINASYQFVFRCLISDGQPY